MVREMVREMAVSWSMSTSLIRTSAFGSWSWMSISVSSRLGRSRLQIAISGRPSAAVKLKFAFKE